MNASRIEILASDVVDQIAAGEVVERPASVVKELVENAIDADAKRIDVLFEAGGRKKIQIVDDGCGMTEQEARLCILRHATSKLRTAEDLNRISTLGFRGEALSSIAAVAKVTILTKQEAMLQGARLTISASQVELHEPAGCRKGTHITVEDLFYNTPARLKFLKSVSTEGIHAHDEVMRQALAHPEIHFTLTQDGRSVLDLPLAVNRLARVRQVNPRQKEWFHQREVHDQGLRVEVCVAPASASGRSGSLVTMIVNNRYVRDRALLQAVVRGYEDTLPRGYYPLAAVFIDLDHSKLDVNVHPQKTEVRFAEPARIFSAVLHTVTAALSSQQILKLPQATRSYQLKAEPSSSTNSPNSFLPLPKFSERRISAHHRFWSGGDPQMPGTNPPSAAAEADVPYLSATKSVDLPWLVPVASKDHPLTNYQIRGQWLNLFLLLEATDELAVLDLRNCWEVIWIKQLSQQITNEGQIARRSLDPSLSLPLSANLEKFVMEHQEDLSMLGWEMESFGSGTWTLRTALPLAYESMNVPLAIDLLQNLEQASPEPVQTSMPYAQQENWIKHLVQALVKTIELPKLPLSIDDFLANLQSLAPELCTADGRPLLYKVGRATLEKHFGR